MVAKYHAMTILTSRMHTNNKKKLPRSFIKSLLIDLKAAHKLVPFYYLSFTVMKHKFMQSCYYF